MVISSDEPTSSSGQTLNHILEVDKKGEKIEVNVNISLWINYVLQEKKRIQLLGEKEDLFRLRQGTSNYRIPNRSLNSSFNSTSSLIRKVTGHADQQGLNNSTAQITRGRKDGKRIETHKILANHSPVLKTDTASVISTTFSGTSSP